MSTRLQKAIEEAERLIRNCFVPINRAIVRAAVTQGVNVPDLERAMSQQKLATPES